MGAQQWGTRVP